MKILHIETGRHLYGGALQVFYLLRGLHQQGVKNVLVCAKGSAIAQEAQAFAKVIELPMFGDGDPRFLLGLIRSIHAERPSVVHAHSRRGADWMAGLSARFCGVRSVLTRRVDNPESRTLARLKYGSYDRVVTISDGIRQVLLGEGISAEHVELIHSVVDHEPYLQPCDRAWFEAEFGIRPGEKCIAVIAQLIDRKGHRFLLEALPAILSRIPQLKVIFFGKGPLRQELETTCVERSLAGKVIFAGFRDDLSHILPCLDLVVHPALMEGLGVSLLQAAAAGVPIVASRAGGIPEVVRDGVNGYLVEPGDVGQLSSKALAILEDASLGRRFGFAGRGLVLREFSITTMVERYQTLYASLVTDSHHQGG